MKSILVLAGAMFVTSACASSEPTSNFGPDGGAEAIERAPQNLATTLDDGAFVSRQGSHLYLQNSPVAFVGVDRYELAGGPLAATCAHASDASAWAAYQDDFIQQAAAMGVGLIRLWAFQNFAGPSGTDFSALDQVVASAKKYNVRLILTLENNWADCTQPTANPKDDSWFGGGYKNNYGYALNFVDYTTAIVTHFKNEPQIAMWQILNEGKWYQAPAILQQFFVDISNLIRSIDGHHLISSGGAIQCWQGAQGAADFQSFYDAPNIDVFDAHDYGSESEAWPDCMQAAWQAAQNLDKPFMIGESGVNTDQFSASDRATYFASKMQTAASKGTAAYLIWSLNTQADYHDGFDFFPGDATAAVVQQAAKEWYNQSPAAPAPTPTPAADPAPAATPAADPTLTPTATPTADPAPAPAPAPTATPAPDPTPTPSPAQDATFGCSISAAAGNTWQTGDGTYAGIMNLTISNTGNATLPTPWTIQVSVDGMTAMDQPWTWEITGTQANVATGTVSAEWAALLAHGENAVGLGAMVALSKNALTVQSVQINGNGCTVVQSK